MRLRRTLLLAVLAFAPLAGAQTLVEVTLVTAIMSDLHPGLHLPSGSLRALGSGTERVIARVPDAPSWTDWEVYTATGLAAALEPALVHNIETELFIDGFERTETTPTQEGATQVTRVVFANPDGRRTLLVTFRTGQELVWLLARGR